LTEFIETQGRWRNFDAVFPVIIMIGLIGFFSDQFLAWFRGVLFPYTRKSGVRTKKTERVEQASKATLSETTPVPELTPTWSNQE
jgi:NitT/TauT family transport system permease protein